MNSSGNVLWHITVEENGKQKSSTIHSDVVTLGRDRGNSVPIDSVLVSGFHLELALYEDDVQATDLASRNGSAILRSGGRKPKKLKPRKPTNVDPGDILLLGAAEAPVRVQVVIEHTNNQTLRMSEAIRASREANEISAVHVEPSVWPLLLDLNRQLLNATSQDQLLEAALTRVLALIPEATHATVAFFGPRGSYSIQRVVQLVRGTKRPVTVPVTAISHTLVDRIPLERVVSECVGLLWSEGTEQKPTSRTLCNLEVQAAIIAPLWVRKDVLGVIQADIRGTKNTSDLSSEHLDCLLALAGPLALALRNANTLRQFRNQRDTLAVENTRLQVELSQGLSKPLIIGKTASMVQLREMISRVAPSDLSVLIVGETGTGKELVAKTIHSDSSRASKAFVACNVATLPPELVEAELFGAAKGAYTGANTSRAGLFEAADSGTLFLDEIGELKPEIQAKLLRALQEGEYRRLGETRTRRANVRLVAATNRDLDKMVEQGAFRQDLLFRVNTITIKVPPLRERPEDIPLLSDHLLHRICLQMGREIPEISDEVRRMLSEHLWPGNVRQLENELARAVAMTLPSESITAEALSPQQRKVTNEAALFSSLSQHLPLKEAVGAFEREYVRAMLAENDGNRTHTAQALGLTRAGLQKLIKRHGLQD